MFYIGDLIELTIFDNIIRHFIKKSSKVSDPKEYGFYIKYEEVYILNKEKELKIYNNNIETLTKLDI